MNNAISRRNFLRTGAALTAGLAIAPRTFAASGSIHAYAGTYTGKDGRGEGIYLLDYDPATGALSNRRLAAATVSPSWIAIDTSKKFLYAVNEPGSSAGTVTSFAVEADGMLRKLNTISSQGVAPCYLSLFYGDNINDDCVFVANYMSGTLAVLPIQSDGSLGDAIDVIKHTGNTGAPRATDSPRGSFSSTGHEAPHAHFIQPDRRGLYILATDLGQDRIYTYRRNNAGMLFEQSVATIPAGDGPRHLAFHPNGQWIYLITEQASTVVFFHYDQETGTLKSEQTISTLPEGFAGTSYGSEILVHPNGRWLYAANRLHDSIAAFAIAADGRLTRIGHTHTEGDYPRHLALDPAGRFIFSSNQKGDSITSFRIHPQNGSLAATGNYTAVGTPACLVFV